MVDYQETRDGIVSDCFNNHQGLQSMLANLMHHAAMEQDLDRLKAIRQRLYDLQALAFESFKSKLPESEVANG